MTMKSKLMWVLAALLLIVVGVASCSSLRGSGAAPEAVQDTALLVVEPEGVEDVDRQAARIAQEPAQERIVIKNATLAVVVDDPDAKVAQISALAEEFGGWVVSANIQHGSVDGNS